MLAKKTINLEEENKLLYLVQQSFRRYSKASMDYVIKPKHCWILDEKTDIASGLYLISPDGRGGHPRTVCQNTKDHLCSIILQPIRWQGYDTVQMILGILRHHGRVSSSPAHVAGI